MGGSGKKLPGGGARHKANTPRPTAALGAGPIPHPLRIIVGQRFVAIKARRRRAFMISRIERDGRVHAVKEDGARERIQLRAARLLMCDERGLGVHYRFIGYRPGRRYRTFAYVAAVAETTLVLVLPDWHPARTVIYPRRLVPDADAGMWLELTADLGQARPGALNPADLRVCRAPGANRCRRPEHATIADPTSTPSASAVTHGRACGDIVLENSGCWRQTAGGLIEIHVAPHVELRSGGRIYLPAENSHAVASWLDVVSSDPTPNGTRVRCRPGVHLLSEPVPLPGPLLSGRWRWRWWPRAVERPGCAVQISAFAYDPVEHCEDIRWPGGATQRPQES